MLQHQGEGAFVCGKIPNQRWGLGLGGGMFRQITFRAVVELANDDLHKSQMQSGHLYPWDFCLNGIAIRWPQTSEIRRGGGCWGVGLGRGPAPHQRLSGQTMRYACNLGSNVVP